MYCTNVHTDEYLLGTKGSQLPSYVRCHAHHRLYNPSCDVRLFNPFITGSLRALSLSLSLSALCRSMYQSEGRNDKERIRYWMIRQKICEIYFHVYPATRVYEHMYGVIRLKTWYCYHIFNVLIKEHFSVVDCLITTVVWRYGAGEISVFYITHTRETSLR